MTQPDAPSRAHKIAALHAFAQYFADHPDVPVPDSVQGIYLITPADEIDEKTRVAVVRNGARAAGCGISQSGDYVSSLIPVLGKDQGVAATLTLLCDLDEPQRNVYADPAARDHWEP